MRPYWLIAKYIPDMRRREPFNIGVILCHENGVRWRFLAQKADGSVDGRKLRWAGSAANYKAWLTFWEHEFRNGGVERALARVNDSNYFLEIGGERVIGADDMDADSMLDDLYTALVEASPDRDTLSITRLSDTVLNRLGIREQVVTNFRYTVDVANDVRDEIAFDYRYDNGAINLMHRVQLSAADERSWEAAHSAAWAFQQAAQHPVDKGRNQRVIAFVRARKDDVNLGRQLGLLRSHANVIDVLDEELAVAQLNQLLHPHAAE